MSRRSARGSGTVRERKDGRWEGRYTTGRDPGTGRQIQKSVYGATQQEVAKLLRAATASMDKGTYIEPARLTIGQWCGIWLEEYTGHVKPGTLTTYTAQINNHIKPGLGKVRLQALQPHTVQTFCNALQRVKKGGAGLTPKTVKNVHGVLHSALEQAKQIGYIPFNPADNTKLPRIERSEVNPFDSTQIIEFIEAVSKDTYGRVYTLSVLTGLRQSEIIGLTWDCVDFDGCSLYVYRQLQCLESGYQFTSPKNDKPRRLLIVQDAIDVLKAQRTFQKEQRLKAGSAWQPWEGNALVFTDALGGHIKHANVIKHYKKIVKSIGYPEKRFHDMRHTYATMSLMAGVDIKTLQENLGHHSPAFTLERYGHVTKQMRQQGADRLQEFLDGMK